MLDRLPVAWLVAIYVATAGSIGLYWTIAESNLFGLILGLVGVGPFAFFVGFLGAAVFLTPAFLIAYVARSDRRGYVVAGAFAGLSYALANYVHAQASLLTASVVAKYWAHMFAWMAFMFSADARPSVWSAWGISTVIAGALAGEVFARITRPLRQASPETAENPAVKIR